jgi:hypothetical protein
MHGDHDARIESFNTAAASSWSMVRSAHGEQRYQLCQWPPLYLVQTWPRSPRGPAENRVIHHRDSVFAPFFASHLVVGNFDAGDLHRTYSLCHRVHEHKRIAGNGSVAS